MFARRIPAVHEQGALAIEVANLTVRYDEVIALDDVSVAVPAGLQVAVVGPNGSGKSTLLSAIAGMIPVPSGRVSIFGSGPAHHCCIGYVAQRSQMDWTFPVSVADVVMMGRARRTGWFRWPGRADREAVRQSLETVGLEGLSGRLIGELSGGQRQRALIARALAQEAHIMLMDEPLAGLDWPSQQEVMEALDRLRPHGVTVLFSTHNLNLARERFDRVILINQRLVAEGKPDEVLTPARIAEAYGNQMHLVTESGIAMVEDFCCDGHNYE